MRKTMLAAVAFAALLTVPLEASAQRRLKVQGC